MRDCSTNECIASLLDIRADVEPNNNYAILENSLKTAMDNSFTVKRVKFNRKKHKITPWITFDIISEPSMRGISFIEN